MRLQAIMGPAVVNVRRLSSTDGLKMTVAVVEA